MHAVRLRILSGGFIVMSFAVGLNLLALQPDRSTPQLAALQQDENAAPRDQSSAADGRVRLATPTKNPALWKAVLRELVRLDYLPQRDSHEIGARARAAILAFEYDHGLPMTGHASDGLLEALIMGRPRAPGATLTVSGAHAHQIVRLVQTSLTNLGYDVGPVDGTFGPKTRAAIRSFERRGNLEPTGRISADLIERLAAAATPRKSARAAQ